MLGTFLEVYMARKVEPHREKHEKWPREFLRYKHDQHEVMTLHRNFITTKQL